VRLLDVPVEGKLVRGFQGLDVGDRLQVTLVQVDVQRGYIDLAAVPRARHRRKKRVAASETAPADREQGRAIASRARNTEAANPAPGAPGQSRKRVGGP